MIAAVGCTQSAPPPALPPAPTLQVVTATPGPPPVPTPRQEQRYVVREGDTLSGIASDKHVRGGWPALYKANKKAIGGNPNLIFPGQVLRVPQ